jgi:uncharacterized protein
VDGSDRHLPHSAAIEAYGNGGFRFGGLSHRGSLLCLPNGVWASAVASASEIDAAVLATVLMPETAPARDGDSTIDPFLIGTGKTPCAVPPALRTAFRERHIGLEVMTTAAAVHTYNIMLAEGRRVGALLIAVA